jgi:hypothetical protein
VLARHFEHVRLKSIEYVIPSGALRNEAFWRCGHDPVRLDAVAWRTYAGRDVRIS